MSSYPPALRDPREPTPGGAAAGPDPWDEEAQTGLPTPGGEAETGPLAARAGAAVAGLHPVVATVVLTLAAYVVLAAVTVPVGLVLGSSHLGSVDRWDESVNRWFVEQRTSSGDRLSAFGSSLANTLTVVAITAAIVIGLWLARRWKGAVLLVVALSLEVTVFLTTTLIVDRERPEVPLMDEAPPTSSFPSGHTAAAVALYVGLALLCSRAVRGATARIAVLVVAVLVPIGVGVARMYRGMHHPTDVFGGLLLGAACLAAAYFIVTAVGFAVQRRSEGGGRAPA